MPYIKVLIQASHSLLGKCMSLFFHPALPSACTGIFCICPKRLFSLLQPQSSTKCKLIYEILKATFSSPCFLFHGISNFQHVCCILHENKAFSRHLLQIYNDFFDLFSLFVCHVYSSFCSSQEHFNSFKELCQLFFVLLKNFSVDFLFVR